MKINVSKPELIKGISIVQKAVATKTTLPVLANIMMKTTKEGLDLVATDMEIAIRTKIKAEIMEEGSVLVDGKLIANVASKVPDTLDGISFEIKENQMVVKAGSANFEIKISSTQQFPEFPSVKGDVEVVFTKEEIQDTIKKTTAATASEGTRPILTGVLFSLEDNVLDAVALDGYRISKKTLRKDSDNFKKVIPAKCLLEVMKIISATEDKNVKISFANNHAKFITSETEIVTKLLEGEFINYKQIIKEGTKTVIKVDSACFKDSIERAVLLAKDNKHNLIKLDITANKIVISANSEVGKVREEIQAETEGEELQIAFNSKFLLDGLKVIEDKKIQMKFEGSLSPAIIRSAEKEDFTYLVLPVRTS